MQSALRRIENFEIAQVGDPCSPWNFSNISAVALSLELFYWSSVKEKSKGGGGLVLVVLLPWQEISALAMRSASTTLPKT